MLEKLEPLLLSPQKTNKRDADSLSFTAQLTPT